MRRWRRQSRVRGQLRAQDVREPSVPEPQAWPQPPYLSRHHCWQYAVFSVPGAGEG